MPPSRADITAPHFQRPLCACSSVALIIRPVRLEEPFAKNSDEGRIVVRKAFSAFGVDFAEGAEVEPSHWANWPAGTLARRKENGFVADHRAGVRAPIRKRRPTEELRDDAVRREAAITGWIGAGGQPELRGRGARRNAILSTVRIVNFTGPANADLERELITCEWWIRHVRRVLGRGTQTAADRRTLFSAHIEPPDPVVPPGAFPVLKDALDQVGTAIQESPSEFGASRKNWAERVLAVLRSVDVETIRRERRRKARTRDTVPVAWHDLKADDSVAEGWEELCSKRRSRPRRPSRSPRTPGIG